MDRQSARRIALIYAAAAAAWILLSSGVPLLATGRISEFQFFEVGKGLLFVGVTALFLFWLMLRLGHAEETRYRPLFQANPQPMWVYDAHTLRFLDVNDAAVAHYGYARDEFLTMTIKDIRPPSDVPLLAEEISRIDVAERHDSGIWRHQRKDGRVIDVEITSHPVPYAGHAARMVLASDVTERIATQLALAASEQRYRALTEQAIAGVYTITGDRIGYTNPRVAEIFGYEPGELDGRPLREVVAPADWPRIEDGIARLLAGQLASLRMEVECIRKDGVAIRISAHGALATVDGRQVILGMLQDVSETRRAEESVRDYAARLERTLMGTLDIVTRMIELRDPYTSGHQKRVGDIAAAIAAEMGLSDFVQQGLRVAGAVHDVGKIMVPAEILTKPGRLTPTEYLLVQEHAAQGFEVLKAVAFPWPVAEVAGQHHERLDGSGYPNGLKGEAIVLEARIVAVADVVESMAAHRPYRPGLGIDLALAEIEANAGRLYDPAVAAACLRLFRERGFQL